MPRRASNLRKPSHSGIFWTLKLFPLDGAGWFWSEVVEHAVYAFYFGGDACGDVLQEVEWHVFDGSGHGVDGVYGADDDTPFIGTLVVTYANALEVRNRGEVLPYLAFKAVLCEFFAKNSVGFTDCFQTIAGDGT